MELNKLTTHIENSVKFGDLEVSKLTHELLAIEGLTSAKVKMFLNNLCSLENSIYLELGVYKGGTFCSALFQNNCKGVAIDGWLDNLIPNTFQDTFYSNENIQEIFLENIKKYTILKEVEVYKSRFQTFDYTVIKQPTIIFYDGEISQIEIYSTLVNLFKVLKGTFIMVFDDWNWTNQIIKTFLKQHKIKILYEKQIFTQTEDPKGYWNGLGIYILDNN